MRTNGHLRFRWRKFFCLLFSSLVLSMPVLAQDCAGLTLGATATEATCASNGAITVTVTGGTGPFNYKAIGPVSTGFTSDRVISALPPGTYKVVVQDVGKGGCVAELENIVVPGTWTAQNFLLTKTDPGCSNTDGAIQVTGVSGGRPPFTYTIMPGSAAAVGSRNTTGVFTNLLPGEYYIQSEDACHNLVTRSVVLPNFSWTISNVTVNRALCGSIDVVIRIADNKGNTNTSGSFFAGYQYGLVHTDGTITWSATPAFQIPVGKQRPGEVVVKDPCGKEIRRSWTLPAAQVPSLGATVATSNYNCTGTFRAAVTSPTGLQNPTYCLYNSSNVLVECNNTGAFTNLPYGAYCIKMTDACYDTTITRCIVSTPPKPSVSSTVQQSNPTCSTFTATITGKTNISGATYCLVKNDGSNETVRCNTTGVFDNVPYGSYCITIQTDPNCYDTTITRCFTAARPLPNITSVRMTSGACNAITVDNPQGQNLPTGTQYCLYDENGNQVACNNTGVFDNLPHGAYCLRAQSACGDWSVRYCFNTASLRPTVGSSVSRYNRSCSTFTAAVSGVNRLQNPVYEIYNSADVLVASNATGVFGNLVYGSYCIKVKNDPACYDTTITRCFTESKPPVAISGSITLSNPACSTFTATITGTGLTNPTYYLLNTSNDTVARNNTGVFTHVPYGAYCGLIIDGCAETLRVCQTFAPERGITLASDVACNPGHAEVFARLTSKSAPYNFYFYHPDGRLLYSVIGSATSVQRAELPGQPSGAQYKVVGEDRCGLRDSAYITPQASVVVKTTAVRQRCPSGTWATGSGDLTVTAHSATFGTVTPRLIKKDGTAISVNYTTRSGNDYTFLDLGPAAYVIEYTVSSCGTRLYDTVRVNPYAPPAPNNSAIFQCDNNSFSVNSGVIHGVSPFIYEIIGNTPADPSIVSGPQTSPVFTINNGTAYSVVNLRATDACGNSAIDNAAVRPLGSQVITRTGNCLFNTITLSVDPVPGATYQWYKKTSTTDSVLIGTENTYTIPFMLEPDIATYVCKTSVNSTCLTRLSYIEMTGDCGGQVLNVPLQLQGKKTAQGHLLTWNSAADRKGATYTVERKTASGFITIARGGYTQSGLDTYSFVDAHPASGANQYRVKKTLPSGAVAYSNILVMVNTTAGVAVYPNPVQESFTVEVHNAVATHYRVALYTADGQLLWHQPLFVNKKATATYPRPAGVKAGTYVLRLTNLSTGTYENQKLLFQ